MSQIDRLVQAWEEDMLDDRFPDQTRHTKVDTGHWQGLKDVPHTQTREKQYANFHYHIPELTVELAREVDPNFPWAEDHFKERVAGQPTNPGEEYKNWPWYKGGVEDHKKQGQFSHTYMERYWPKKAGTMANRIHPDKSRGSIPGIRYEYGDLQDVVNLLAQEPTTRQAYLPVWFPEDTGAAGVEGQRVPCSLGYHFMLREGRLNCMYHMRSCDLIRYFRDDVYLTCRLVQWVLKNLQGMENQRIVDTVPPERHEEAIGLWEQVKPGVLFMTIASLHIFEGDVPMLRRKHDTA